MPWAVFTDDFEHDRRPHQAISFVVTPGTEPQQYPKDVIDAAVAAGKARRVASPKAASKRRSTTKPET